MKRTVIERDQRKFRVMLYKYFTNKNMSKYIDVLPKFVGVYSDTVHSNNGVASSKLTDSDVLPI